MIASISKLWTRLTREFDLPPEMPARLVAPLNTRVGSLLIGHVADLLLGALTIVRIDGIWPPIIMVASLVVLALRLFTLHRLHRLPLSHTPHDLRRWRGSYQAIGYARCLIGAAACGLCIVATDDDTMQLVAIAVTLGMTAGIASRSGDTMRFALIQIVIRLLPVSAAAARAGGYGRWIILSMGLVYFCAMVSIVRRHYATTLAMIEAERTSRSAQTALAEREADLRGIFDNAAAGIAEFDIATNRLVRVNRVFCDMIGLREADLLADFNLAAATHPEDQAEQARQWAVLRETGQSFACERRYIRSDGSIGWTHVGVSVASSDTDGRPRRILSINQDITERKVAEATLQTSQNWLRLSLDIGSVGTFRRDYTTGLIFCGPETREMNGLPLGDAPITAALWLATVLPEDVPQFLKDVEEAHAERRSIVSFNYRFLHPERGIRYVETRSRVEYDATGRAVSSVGVLIDVTDRRHTENRLAHLAHHDPLTDLPNRSLFRIQIEAALARARQGEPCAALCLDLDHFKDVNDTLGHSVGDALLKAVAERLKALCRSTDTVARLGGDEFALIQSPLAGPADAKAFAERIISVLAKPYDVDGHRVVIETSIGIAMVPGDSLDLDHLLRNADMALYSAKDAGRGCHRFFEPAMDEKVQARRALDGDLRQALADSSLELFYQPLISIATHRVRGFEALIRWRHPTRGLVMPDQFIALAESNGLIVPIGAFVLQRACAQAVLWPNGPSVAVNLSASEFSNPNLVETVAGALRQSALDPKRLELEITESTMLRDTQATLETLHRLKALGVRLSIDDFGTGFSSLGYLQRFPFDKVKIDRSFVTPLGCTRESLAIVGAVINLCTGLDMETTAEGVETEDQLAILSRLGCTEAQGYYFSRPRPADEIAGLIEQLEGVAHQTVPMKPRRHGENQPARTTGSEVRMLAAN